MYHSNTSLSRHCHIKVKMLEKIFYANTDQTWSSDNLDRIKIPTQKTTEQDK